MNFVEFKKGTNLFKIGISPALVTKPNRIYAKVSLVHEKKKRIYSSKNLLGPVKNVENGLSQLEITSPTMDEALNKPSPEMEMGEGTRRR